jgi:hypothetical protein
MFTMDTADGWDEAMSPEALQALYARTAYLLRESRKTLLKAYGVDQESMLLERIKCKEVAEHPAYDHYLSALIMEQMRMQVRADMLAKLADTASTPASPISLHLVLQQQLETHFGARMTEPVRMAQDALLLSFDTGLMMEVRYFSSQEYAIDWSWGEAQLRIDTAPVHSGCASAPHHLHGENGEIMTDFFTQPGIDCWANFSRLLSLLLNDPLLVSHGADSRSA